jgi:hypothetical protein
MENIIESKQLILDAKNIYLIPSQEPEALALTLALFYTLKQQGKNVNLIIETLPESLKFLSPSLDFIYYPKNFVISIPNKVAGISQVFYEKNDEALKIHLTLENGNIKKENIAFYFSEAKPDLIITLGIKDYAEQLSGKLNSFGFLLDSPILNVDNSADNKKFGKINLLSDKSLTEIIFSLAKNLHEIPVTKNIAECFLTGIVIRTDNFKKNLTADIFEISSLLMKSGAELGKITSNLYNNG